MEKTASARSKAVRKRRDDELKRRRDEQGKTGAKPMPLWTATTNVPVSAIMKRAAQLANWAMLNGEFNAADEVPPPND